jgi:BR serine/threonine kinase
VIVKARFWGMTGFRLFQGEYELEEVLGVGSQGTVRAAVHRGSGTKVAIKIVPKSSFNGPNEHRIRREIALMRIFDHPHILRLLDVCETDDAVYLVLEFMENGELFDLIAEQGALPFEVALKYFRQIVFGLEFLHALNICHCDLKPENLLLDERDNVKISDFGFAEWAQNGIITSQCGSVSYGAPELAGDQPRDGFASDIWSLGVVLYMLLCVSLLSNSRVSAHLTAILFQNFLKKY